MRLHGFLADAKLCTDLFVRHPLHRPGDNLLLPVGQAPPNPRQGFLQLIYPLPKVFHHPGQEPALRSELSDVSGANGFGEFRWRSRLEQAPRGTVLQGAHNELFLETVSEDQDLYLRPGALGTYFSEPCKPAHLGHPDIQQQDMQLQCFHRIQHLAAMRCFADDLNVFLLCQEPAKPLPEAGMIVSNEYFDGIHTAKIPLLPARDEQPLLACRNNSQRIDASWIVPPFSGS
jgi:hypothetical protein